MKKRTFVVTPDRQSFDVWCETQEKAGYVGAAVHISHENHLLGRYIREGDKVTYFNISGFDDGELELIKQEVSKRKLYG